MSDNFGLRIDIEGEKAFKQSLKDINNGFKILGSEMKLATSSFERNERSIESLTATNKVLENQITSQRNKIDTLKSALDNASNSFGENDRRTQQWQVQLNNATADLNKMERELSNNTREIEGLSNAMNEGADNADDLADGIRRSGNVADDASGKFNKFGSVLKSVGVVIGATVVAIGAAAVKAGAELIKLGDEFNVAVNKISASTGATGKDLEKLGEIAQKVYTNNFGDSLDDVAEGLSQVQKITGLVDDELQKATQSGFALRDTFGYDLQESARTAQSLMKNFGVSAEQAYNLIAVGAQNGADKNGDLLDTLNEYSAQYSALGLSSDEFITSLITGADAGVFSIDKVGDAVKEFNIRAKDGSKSTIDAFNSLGLNAQSTMSAFASGGEKANKAFYDVVSALDSMSDPMQKNATAVALFGTQYEDLESTVLPVLSSMKDGSQNVYDALTNISKINYDNLDSAIEGTKRSIEGVFLPTVSQMSSGITDVLSTLGNEINNANGDFTQISKSIGTAVKDVSKIITEQMPMFIQLGLDIITAIGGALVDNLPVVIDAVVKIVMTIFEGLISALPQISEGALQLVLALVNGIIENLPALLEAAILVVVTLVQGIAEALPQLIPALVQAVILMCQTLIENLPLILDAALQIILGLVEGLLTALPVLIQALPKIILAIVEFVISAIPQIIDAGIKLLTSLVTALPEIITAIVIAIPEIITGLVTVILTGIPQIIMAGIKLLISLIANLPQIIGEIIKAVPQIIVGIVSAFGKEMFRITEIGGDIVRGLWDGISGLASWLWDNVSGWIDGIWDGICSFFGIQSPSKEMAWVGEMLVSGLSGAIDKDGKKAVNSALNMSKSIMNSMRGLTDDMQNVIPTDFQANVNGTVTSGNSSNLGSNPLHITIQNFYNNREQDVEQLAYELEFYRQRMSYAKGGV